MSKFKVGDRVRVPHQSETEERTIVTVREGICYPYVLDSPIWHWDNVYSAKELQLITNQGGAPMARKTYKLIKDTPTVSKGAIYQEACDDGTQEYVILDKSFIKDTSGTGQAPIHTRSLVEEQKNWFVEVFAVEPQYMTRDELDQWEAFKAGKAKKPAAKKVAVKTTTKSAWTPARRKAHSAKIKAAWAAKKATKA